MTCDEVDRFSVFATLLGIVLTAVYLAGLIERRHKSVFGIGMDSLIVLIAYVRVLVLLFSLR
jgi:cation:H+ antiporter